MALYVAIMGEERSPAAPVVAPWGTAAPHSWQDAATLATDPDVLAEGVRQVLVLCPARGAGQARIAASTIASARPETSVRVDPLPVSLGVLARAVELVAEAPPGANRCRAALAATLDRMVWGAWLPSVTRLEAPPPTMTQHLQSMLSRGAGFLAVHGDPGWVARLPLDQVEPARRLARRPGEASEPEATAYGELPEPAIETLFAMGLAGRPARREPLGDALSVWGRADACEFVISPAAAVDPGPPTGGCPTCLEPTWADFCPFCRVASAREPHHRVDQGVTI